MTGSDPRTLVREATAADAAEIVRLGELMYNAVDIQASEEWRANALRQVSERIGGPDLSGWVIDADPSATAPGGPLAASALANRHPRLSPPGQSLDWRAYVQWISTDPAFRRLGYARALTQRVLDWADAEGVDVVELHSSPYGRSLYLELGFVEFPPVEYPADVRGVPMLRRRPTGAGH